MQAQTSQQCVVVSFDTYCMNARGKINIYDIPILSFNISLDNPNLANLVSRQMEKNVAKRPPHGKKCSQYNHYTEKNVAKRPPHGKKVRNIVII